MTVPPPRPSRRALSGIVTLALAGCSRLFVNPPPQYIFRLTPVSTFSPDLPHVHAQLLVDAPTASASLDRRRIALTRSLLSIDYFADAEWEDTLSALVQTVLANSFENSRAIATVGGSLGLRADFVLGTEIRHFEAQYGTAGPPDARVSIRATLVAIPSREVVAQALFERRVPASGNDLPAIVNAFDAALGTVVARIVSWTLANAAMPRGRRTL